MLVQRLRALVGLNGGRSSGMTGVPLPSPHRLGSALVAGTRFGSSASTLDETVVLPTTEFLQQVLDDHELRHFVDADGDLTVRWKNFSIYFFHYGKQREVLQARLYLDRRFEVESRAAVALALDDWNRTKLFPKAYTVLPDDGYVGICAEQCYDFEVGVTRAQLTYTIGVWIETLVRFATWVEEQVWVGEQ
ncbi:putative sensory transduction regulator [Jatrophihabitans sp. GAS493]|uniref:YbjN domain-containing protein n=1 Tax=Jatrophihabitans sp. GAS493 TaxID=1907575 RepID=UPI000BB78FD7|nr:YbjN domain-containing protein [Jatrophihabitans sp. GAS493]SOD74695.1 putative sensory transduction regulator [Jatrophihabitans sp. GAS493]